MEVKLTRQLKATEDPEAKVVIKASIPAQDPSAQKAQAPRKITMSRVLKLRREVTSKISELITNVRI